MTYDQPDTLVPFLPPMNLLHKPPRTRSVPFSVLSLVLAPRSSAGRSIIPVVIRFSLLTHGYGLEFCRSFREIL